MTTNRVQEHPALKFLLAENRGTRPIRWGVFSHPEILHMDEIDPMFTDEAVYERLDSRAMIMKHCVG